LPLWDVVAHWLSR